MQSVNHTRSVLPTHAVSDITPISVVATYVHFFTVKGLFIVTKP